MSETPINGPYLTEMCGDDVEFEKELIDSYLDASPALLATTRSGVISGDADAVRTSAPTRKGSSRATGAGPIAEVDVQPPPERHACE